MGACVVVKASRYLSESNLREDSGAVRPVLVILLVSIISNMGIPCKTRTTIRVYFDQAQMNSCVCRPYLGVQVAVYPLVKRRGCY